jgi:NAD(P)-dependent dehydrogenase (short-subunit alcohol dehydrogenase family)
MGMLDNKVAIITRAALGIGAGCAERFVKEGAAVVISDLRVAPGEELAARIHAGGGRAVFHSADVSSEDAIKALVDRAVSEFGRLDIMFNNEAAFEPVGPLEATRAEDWDRCFAVGLRSVFLGIKHAVPQMRKAGGGTILNNASVAAIRAEANSPAYSAVKAAMVNLTASAAIQLAKDKIRVNCISPGVINTPTVWSRLPGGEAEAERLFANAQPIPRIGRPSDVAGIAAFLCSDDAEWITGINLVIDGGAIAGHYERPRRSRR